MKMVTKLICEHCENEWPATEVEIVDVEKIPKAEVVIFTCPGCLKQSGNSIPQGAL